MNLSVGRQNHELVLDFLKKEKEKNPNFTVLDVGASASPWTAPVLTATFDMFDANIGAFHFKGNINNEKDWEQVIQHVIRNGKFSYSICSHTLEDVAYPVVALKMLPQVSEAGFISMPSKFRELCRNLESSPWRGYIHHRWIYCIKNGEVVVVPKIPAIEYLDIEGDISEDLAELQIRWEGELPYTVLNGDYLGPNKECVLQMYRDILTCQPA